MTSSNKAIVLSATAACVAGVCVGMCLQNGRRGRSSRSRHPVGSEERDIERHILSTQRPAATLGIVVDEVTSNSLTLSAPLEPNTNVHGTAFAGSLYSVAVLCAYYLGRSYLQRRPDVLHREFTVVARSGTIQYKRPVSHRIVAVSVLPEDEQILDRFAKELSDKGKAFMDVSGTIRTGDGKVACEYTIEVCAYEPRK